MTQDKNNTIPRMYKTDGIPFDEKTIHQKYEIKEIGFYWLIAELNPEENLAFGYANLNDDYNAEWGNIGLDEVMECGGRLDRGWTPTSYREAMKRIREERRGQ